eukprot:jgi/Mesvir1/7151/Mv02511-RA.1
MSATENDGESKGNPTIPPPKAPQFAPPQPIRIVKVEEREKSWKGEAGIAGVDRSGPGSESAPLERQLLLAAGDVVALIVFATIGTMSHNSNDNALQVAMPFILGWFAAAPFVGAFDKDACGSKVVPASFSAAKGWAVGFPLGHVFRAISLGRLPAQPFLVVSGVATFVLLVGWRAALASKSPGDDAGKGPRAPPGNKKGNPLEFLQLLGGLTKRW